MLKNKRLKPISLLPLIVSLFLLISAFAHAEKVVVIPLGTTTNSKTTWPSNIVTVAQQNGDFTSIIEATNSIIDASENNPYVVKVMPGTYDVGTDRITVNPYVDLIGSGQNTTIIKGNYSSPNNMYGVVNLSGPSMLSDLSVVNTGSPTSAGEIDYLQAVSIVGAQGSDGDWGNGGLSTRRHHVKINNVNIVARNARVTATALVIDNSNTVEINNSVIEVYQYNQTGEYLEGIFIRNSSHVYLNNLRIKTGAGKNGVGVKMTYGTNRVYMHSLNVDIYTNDATDREFNAGILTYGSVENIFLHGSYINSPQGTAINVGNDGNIVITGSTLRYGDFDGAVVPVTNYSGGTATCIGSSKISDPSGVMTVSPISTACQ